MGAGMRASSKDGEAIFDSLQEFILTEFLVLAITSGSCKVGTEDDIGNG